jgi:hypothetical protein
MAWRPDNDWLLRAGKFRVPLFLFSETQDIGTSHDMARLPNDSYTLNPTSDFTGPVRHAHLAAGRTRAVGRPLFGLCQHQLPALGAGRPAAPLPPGPFFNDVKARATGVVLTLRDPASRRAWATTAFRSS